MDFLGSFSIDSDSIQLLMYLISANFIWQKMWRRHLENQPICLIPDCQHQPAQTLKGCLQIFYYIKMAQTWWDHCWVLSEAMLRIQAFFQKLCPGYWSCSIFNNTKENCITFDIVLFWIMKLTNRQQYQSVQEKALLAAQGLN